MWLVFVFCTKHKTKKTAKKIRKGKHQRLSSFCGSKLPDFGEVRFEILGTSSIDDEDVNENVRKQ